MGESSFLIRAGLAVFAVGAGEADPRIGMESLTSDPKRLARAAARSSSAVRAFGGPILADPDAAGLWGRTGLGAVRDGPVGAFATLAGVPLAGPPGVGGTEPEDRVARGPAGGG